MHLAILTDGITPFVTGGMQRHSANLVKYLLKEGVKITLDHCIVGDDSFPPKTEIYEQMKSDSRQLEIHTLRFPSFGAIPGHYMRESYRYSCMIYELLEPSWGDFDFIYAKGFTSWCLLEKKKKGKHIAPVGVKFHGYEMFHKIKNLKGKVEQFMLRPPVVFMNRNADVVFSYGGRLNEIILKIGVPEEKIISIGSGIDDTWVLQKPPSESDTRRFLFIGRNERRKGLDDIKALDKHIGKLPIEFHFIGPIPKEKKLKSKNCRYHGEISDPAVLKSIIDRCQVLVAPSHAEGMPNVIMEAMSRGLAILTTDVGAVPILVSKENGVLIRPSDRNALLEALNKFANMSSEELSMLRSTSIKKINSEFLWTSVARKTLHAIEKVTFTSGK